MSVPLTTLRTAVRRQTNTVGDDVAVTDSEIDEFLSDGGRALADIFNESAPHWLQASYDFVLAGGTFDTSTTDLPDDFELDLGLDCLDTGRLVPIDRLPSFRERATAGMGGKRNYQAQGDELRVYAYQDQTAGSYRLWYVRQFLEMADPVTLDIDVNPLDYVQNVSAGGFSDVLGVVFTGSAFDDELVGGTVTIDFDAPNDGYNGTHTIQAILGSVVVTTTPVSGVVPWTLPTAGTASITYQPTATQPDLPNVWVPFKRFIITHASISVRMKNEEGIGELQTRLQQEAARATRIAQRRDSDLAQIPIIGDERPYFDPGSEY